MTAKRSRFPRVMVEVFKTDALQNMEETIMAVAARFHIRAAALTTYNPDLDQDEKTLRAGLRIIELLAECPGDPHPTNEA